MQKIVFKIRIEKDEHGKFYAIARGRWMTLQQLRNDITRLIIEEITGKKQKKEV